MVFFFQNKNIKYHYHLKFLRKIFKKFNIFFSLILLLNLGNINNVINNPPTDVNNNEINLFFFNKLNSRVNIKATYDEYIGSIITRYINKTHDYNINIYIVNGQKLDESKTVLQNGLMNGSHILVEPTQNILGA